MIRAFGVGQAKCGTATLTAVLREAGSAAHEPERADTLALIRAIQNSGLDSEQQHAALLARERRLGLEFDVAWANQFILPQLRATFPEARFIVQTRDPGDWLYSVAGHLTQRQIPEDVAAFLPAWFRPDEYPVARGREDEAFARKTGFSVGAFLAAWNRHVVTCFEQLPDARRYVLPMAKLHDSLPELSRFLELPEGSLSPRAPHLNRGSSSVELETLLDPGFVDAQVAEHCGPGLALLGKVFSPDHPHAS